MHPPLTYELRVTCTGDDSAALATKEQLVDWLLMNGVESFVEGQIDVDFNQNQDEPPRDFYAEMGGDLAPLSVYRYSRESLDDLRIKMQREFGARLTLALESMETAVWMEGWKESFKPFATAQFYVRPPWEPALGSGGGSAGEGAELHDLVIEPGMAFGTGQHATTRLCLDLVGDLVHRGGALPGQTVLDVGTGTGILAIAAAKLGYGSVIGTDIEDDAILAARDNAAMNKSGIKVQLGSIPDGGPWDLVLANILAVVLIRMMDELAAAAKPGAFLVLSGLLAEEADEVTARGRSAGLTFVRQVTMAGWAALLLQKPAAG